MRRRTVVALGCAIMVALCVMPSHAHAQRTSSLSWVRLSGTEDCISTQALAARVEERVGHAVFVSASQADLSLEGHVERVTKPSGFVAELVVSDRLGHVRGQRVLRAAGDDCAELTAPLVLVIAIAIDPRAALPARAPAELSPETKAMLAQLGLPELSEERIRAELAVPDASAPEHVDAAVAHVPASAPTQTAPRAPPSSAQHDAAGGVHISARLSAELGVLLRPAFGLALGPSFDITHALAIDLWLTALLPQTATFAGAAISASFELIAAGAGACSRFGAGHALELRACAGARAGVMFSQGQGFVHDQAAASPWFEPTLYAGPRFRSGHWLAVANLGAGVPLVRDEFRYQSRDGGFHSAHRAAPLVGRIEIGAGIAF